MAAAAIAKSNSTEELTSINPTNRCMLFEFNINNSLVRCNTSPSDYKGLFALLKAKKATAAALVVGLSAPRDVHKVTRDCRRYFPALFSIVLNKQISECCRLRLDTFAAG